MNRGTRVAIALGSNLGNRENHLSFAAERLQSFLSDFRVSNFHETEPVGVEAQPQFLNAAATRITTLSACEVLEALLAIEHECGRQRPYPGAARTLDLDLILFGDVVVDEPDLRVPHPRFRERDFVLRPLSEIAAGLRDPVTGLTITELLENLASKD